MLLSIIIPLYNNKSYLPDCLDSILAQELNKDQLEVIIVDDGSTDGSDLLAKEYAKRNDHFQVIIQTNQGNGMARENGLAVATGKYIFFVDSDDYLVTNTLKPLLELMEAERLEILRFSAKNTYSSFNPDEKPRFFEIHKKAEVVTGIQFLAQHYYSPEVWRFILKRSLISENNISFVPDHYIQDSFYTPEIYIPAKRTIYGRLDVYRYRQNSGSVTKRKTDEHIRKYVDSIEYGIKRLSTLINSMQKTEPYAERAIAMLTTKLQWYGMLYIIRYARCSDDTKELEYKLIEMKRLNAFPLNELKGGPYDSLKYKILRIIFNNRMLRNIFTIAYRKYYQFKK
ncbi:glycosyltransferase [Flavobacteriaceae bacterium M23B6Z8]